MSVVSQVTGLMNVPNAIDACKKRRNVSDLFKREDEDTLLAIRTQTCQVMSKKITHHISTELSSVQTTP
jgi:hypothetical protein